MPESTMDRIQDEFGFIKGNILVMAVSSGIWRFSSNLVNPFYPLYVLALGGTYFSIGLISAVGGVLSIFPTLVGGHLADTKGRKKIVGFLTISMGPVKLINAFAPDWTYLLLATAVNSVLSGLRGPAFSAIMADSLEPENRGKGYGAWASLPVIPAIISPAIGGWLIDTYDLVPILRKGYVLVAVMATVAGLLRLLFLQETFDKKEETETLKGSLKSLVSVSRRLPTSLKALLFVNMVTVFGWAVKRRFRVTYAVEVIGLTAAAWGLIFTLTRVIRIIVLPLLGHTVDTVGRKILLLLTSIIIPLMDIVFVFATDFFSAFLAFASFYIARHVRGTAIKALRADFSPREERGKIYSLFRAFSRPTRMIGPLFGGFLYGGVSKSSPFFMEVLLSFGLLVLVIALIHEPEEKEE